MTVLALTMSALALVPLVSVLFMVVIRGIATLRPSVFWELPPAAGMPGGGLGNALVGTVLMVVIASVIAVPLGVLAAVFVGEFAPESRTATVAKFAAKVLTGMPSILAGVFAYIVVVLVTGNFSAWAGGFALSILMLPIVMLTAADAIRGVPQKMREASMAMGTTRTQMVWKVVLPTALPGILTGVMLAVARAAGETAPLLFTALFFDYWPHAAVHGADGFPRGLDLQLCRRTLPQSDRDGLAGGARFGRAGPGRQHPRTSGLRPVGRAPLKVYPASREVRNRTSCPATRTIDLRTVRHPSRSTASSSIAGSTTLTMAASWRLRDVQIPMSQGTITAFIGPSGCGKSTALRCLNRMNDLVRGFRFEGQVLLYGLDIYDDEVDPVAVRRNIGMVFQMPNPFAMSIFNNVAFGLRLNRYPGDIPCPGRAGPADAALWDEVKDNLMQSGLSLSGGQQQRLCIARAIATEPEVLLMDEPCSALDPIATGKIEDLMRELKQRFTIVIVTHNMDQARRVADMTAFYYVDTSNGRTGFLVEYGETAEVFDNPRETLTKEYVSGEFS